MKIGPVMKEINRGIDDHVLSIIDMFNRVTKGKSVKSALSETPETFGVILRETQHMTITFLLPFILCG